MLAMENWMSVSRAAEVLGYSGANALRRRIRQLRELGQVQDLGDPPPEYKKGGKGLVRVYWVNPVTMLMELDPPKELLDPRLGRRKRA